VVCGASHCRQHSALFTQRCYQRFADAVSSTAQNLRSIQLPVSWLRRVRFPSLTTEGVSTSQCRCLRCILIRRRNSKSLCTISYGNLAARQHFRLATAGPFPIETLGWVSRRDLPYGKSLLRPSCGSQPVSPFSSSLSQRVLRTQARAIQGHRTLALMELYSPSEIPQEKKHDFWRNFCVKCALTVENCGNLVILCKPA
jgi:hypothetical protein